ncbi:MAG: S41 family peptidase [bacterium]|nr:S41 family peptidase [bacterium]
MTRRDDHKEEEQEIERKKKKHPIAEYLGFNLDPDEEEEEETTSHDATFMRGIITGVILSLIVAVVVGSTWYFLGSNRRSGKSDGGVSLDYSKVSEKLKVLEQYVDYVFLDKADAEKLETGIYNGFVDALGDKYSSYYTAEEYQDLMESTDGQYCGIGAYVAQDKDTGTITITSPFENGPAAKAGIKENDVLYSVNGKEVKGQELNDVVSSMKGTAGTKVKVGVLRDDSTTPLYVEITLEDVEVPTVSYKMLEDKIGYIIVSKFDKVTSTQFRTAIDDLQKQGMKGLVIDLRGNPGGLLTSVTDMLDRIIKDGTLVYTKDKNGEGETFKAEDKDSLDLPMSVLINKGSASASELFAGAIQDYGVGTLVGTTSYGKGIVQNIYKLYDGSAIKLTVSKYYTPKGRNIQGTGIEPDIKVELDEDLKNASKIPVEKDNQLQKAVEIVQKKIK